jgi:hypothetical protein
MNKNCHCAVCDRKEFLKYYPENRLPIDDDPNMGHKSSVESSRKSSLVSSLVSSPVSSPENYCIGGVLKEKLSKKVKRKSI